MLGPTGNYTTWSTYSINGGPFTPFTASDEVNNVQYRVQFYASDRLSNSQHILLIMNYGDWYYLDYIQVTVSDETSSPSVSVASSSSLLPSPPSSQPNGIISSSQRNSAETTAPVASASSQETPLNSNIISSPQLEPSILVSVSGSSSTGFSFTSQSDNIQTSETSRFPVSTENPQPISGSSNTRMAPLGTGAIVGIVVACIGLLISLSLLFWYYKKQNKSHEMRVSHILDINDLPVGTCSVFFFFHVGLKLGWIYFEFLGADYVL